jgi:lipoprotein-releasing system permease protein
MQLGFRIAVKQLLARKRQSLVSLSGIVLGVAFFLAVASLMIGSENDFIKRLVDNSPHITIRDEYRNPRQQPLEKIFNEGAIEIRNVKPLNENRGIRNYERILHYLRSIEGVKASAVLTGQAIISYAGKDLGVTLNGMLPEEIKTVTSVENYMLEGSVDGLLSNPDGIIVGADLLQKLALNTGDQINLITNTGQKKTFKILGKFKTGRSTYDETQAYLTLKRTQALLNRPRRINTILVKTNFPYRTWELAEKIEQLTEYKSISWQEASRDLMNTIKIRNTIMYTVVSAVLIVAAFGIYNVISTVVMEKYRDIAILKSVGFQSSDIKFIFLVQGLILGLLGCIIGLPLGMVFMKLLMLVKFKPPGANEIVSMPVDWGITQFLIAICFALGSSLLAAYLPAQKASQVKPVDILRGGAW